MVKSFVEKKSLSNLRFYLAYSFDGIIVFVILIICTCGYMRRVPKLREWFLSEKKGFAGIFYKGLFAFYFYRLLSFLLFKRQLLVLGYLFLSQSHVFLWLFGLYSYDKDIIYVSILR